MKIVAVLGSPDKFGASSTIAKEIISGAKAAGHDVAEYYVNHMDIKGCRACRVCKREGCDCIIDDDLKPYWKDLHECGALILASPNYCSNVTGPMMTFMNRHYCLMSVVNGKGVPRISQKIKLIGVFSQGNPDPDAYMENYRSYMRDFEMRNMELTDIIVHTGNMKYDKDSEIIKRAYALGASL